jgi:BirA family biotin operon repressor/biotin-[acetyl-CoA-carboxylase] ligase
LYIKQKWVKRCPYLHQKVSVSNGDTTVSGVFEDVDIRGSMLLRLENGKQERISNGDSETKMVD